MASSSSSKASKDPSKKKGDKDLSELLDVTAGMRNRLMTSLKTMLKDSMIADPDMWSWVKNLYSSAVENLWQDFEHEVERSLEKVAVLRSYEPPSEAKGPTSRYIPMRMFLSLRAFVLSHYLPFNKSIFGKLEDPFYLVMYIITLLPIQGLRVAFFSVVLLMLFVPGPPDEFQLINFILLFKGMQFLTGGLLNLSLGSYKYFACYSWYKDDVLTCITEYGPGTGSFWHMLLDYLGSIFLVWVAYFALPMARNLVTGQTTSRRYMKARDSNSPVHEDDAEDVQTIAGLTMRGGKLSRLIQYDMCCFTFSVLMLVLVTLSTVSSNMSWWDFTESPQFKANVFWCIVMYAMLSFPWLLFLVPIFHSVLTHSDPSGFNQNGACVAFGLDVQKDEEAGDIVEDAAGSYGKFYALANTVTTILRIAELGRVERGADRHSEYQRGDFTKGLWVKVFGGGRRRENATNPAADSPGSGAGAGSEAGQNQESGLEAFWAKSKGWWAMMTGEAEQEDTTPVALEVAALRIPRNEIERGPKDKVVFRVQVVPEGSLDAEGTPEPWQVWKCYSDFYELARVLGSGSQAFPDAPFPGRTYLNKLTEEGLELRRSMLEAWVNKVLAEATTQQLQWSRPLYAFLQSDGPKAVKTRGAMAAVLLPVQEDEDEGGPGKSAASFSWYMPASWTRPADGEEMPGQKRKAIKNWFQTTFGGSVTEEPELAAALLQVEDGSHARAPSEVIETLSHFLSESESAGSGPDEEGKPRSANRSPRRTSGRSSLHGGSDTYCSPQIGAASSSSGAYPQAQGDGERRLSNTSTSSSHGKGQPAAAAAAAAAMTSSSAAAAAPSASAAAASSSRNGVNGTAAAAAAPSSSAYFVHGSSVSSSAAAAPAPAGGLGVPLLQAAVGPANATLPPGPRAPANGYNPVQPPLGPEFED
mmetsp:Transcript_40893/g.88209  ORF Transcript_40893/g.88209 Transcript_40893/m.88209 type:complete len:924 (-) Transcript_40893:7-2778(-)